MDRATITITPASRRLLRDEQDRLEKAGKRRPYLWQLNGKAVKAMYGPKPDKPEQQ